MLCSGGGQGYEQLATIELKGAKRMAQEELAQKGQVIEDFDKHSKDYIIISLNDVSSTCPLTFESGDLQRFF